MLKMSLILLLVFAFVSGCADKNNATAPGAQNPDISPAGEPYPKPKSQGTFTREKDIGRGEVTKFGGSCSSRGDSKKIDSRFTIGRNFSVSESRTWSTGAKNSSVWQAKIQERSDTDLGFTYTILEATGSEPVHVGEEYLKTCKVDDKGTRTCTSELIKESKVARTPNSNTIPDCSIKDFGKAFFDATHLQASDGTFTFKNKKSIGAEVFGFTMSGTVVCDGKDVGTGTQESISIRSIDLPDIIYPQSSQETCGSLIFSSTILKLDEGTVLLADIREVLGTDLK